MLFGSETISHYSRGNVTIWMILAFQAGVINIGAFMACHRFVSHVTGFATFFGVELTQSDSSRAFGMLVVPMFFLLGACLSGFLVDVPMRMKQKPRYYVSFGLIFALLSIVFLGGIFGTFGEFGAPLELGHGYVVLILLCLVCGIQNGTITTVSRSIVRTTHLTGITTDLGIGIARLMSGFESGADFQNERRANLMRVGIILFFILGSVVGGFAFRELKYAAFLLPLLTSGNLFALMLYFQVIRRKPVKGA